MTISKGFINIYKSNSKILKSIPLQLMNRNREISRLQKYHSEEFWTIARCEF